MYDLEQFKNFHSGTFLNIVTKEVKQFVLHKDRNELDEYLSFLENVEALIGFNNINYDYPLLHYLIKTKDVEGLYAKGQEIIQSEFPQIKKQDVLIHQLDLYRIWHFNNKSRITSLKKLQVAMKWKKVQDLPIPFDSEITENQIDEVLKYNLNDVMSTYEFYLKSKSVIDLRKGITSAYGINVMNRPDAGMGEDIFASILSKELNIPLYELRKMRTHRNKIDIGQCIVPYAQYNSNEFNALLKKLKSTIITETNGVFDDLSVIYKGFKYDFGTGKLNCPLIQ